MRRPFSWWIMSVVHNCIAHPLLVVSRYLEDKGYEKTSFVIDMFHDTTRPDKDPINRQVTYH